MNRNYCCVMANGVRQIFSKHSTTPHSGQTYNFEYSKHPQREICFVLEGTSNDMLNNNIYVSEPGTVFLVDAWEPHAHCYAENDDNLLHLWFHFTDESLRLVLLRVSNGECIRKIEPLFLPIAFASLLIHRWNMLNALSIVTPALQMEYMAPPINMVIGELNIFLQKHGNQMPSNWKLLVEQLEKLTFSSAEILTAVPTMSIAEGRLRKLEDLSTLCQNAAHVLTQNRDHDFVGHFQ